jgi:hypothetical protein
MFCFQIPCYKLYIKNLLSYVLTSNDALPSFLIDSNVNLRWKQRKSKELGTLFGSQHFGGRGACWSSEMGIRKSDKHQLFTHTYTNQTTNWLVRSCNTLVHRRITGKHGLTRLIMAWTWGSHHLPPYSILSAWPWDQHPNVILSQNSHIWDSRNFGGS